MKLEAILGETAALSLQRLPVCMFSWTENSSSSHMWQLQFNYIRLNAKIRYNSSINEKSHKISELAQ